MHSSSYNLLNDRGLRAVEHVDSAGEAPSRRRSQMGRQEIWTLPRGAPGGTYRPQGNLQSVHVQAACTHSHNILRYRMSLIGMVVGVLAVP